MKKRKKQQQQQKQQQTSHGKLPANDDGDGDDDDDEEDHQLPEVDRVSPRTLFLSSCVMKPHLAVPFLIRKNASTKSFDFSFQSLGDEFISEFAKCLPELPLVEEIVVRDNRITDDGLNCLLEAITQCNCNLRKLDISQNEMGAVFGARVEPRQRRH